MLESYKWDNPDRKFDCIETWMMVASYVDGFRVKCQEIRCEEFTNILENEKQIQTGSLIA